MFIPLRLAAVLGSIAALTSATLVPASPALAQASPPAQTSASAPAQALPAHAHSVPLIKLPNGDYTVPMRELESSGESGRVILHPQGLKTLVTVNVVGHHRHPHRFNLKSGADCIAADGASAVPLKPAVPGQPSQTIVAVPLSDLTSKNYVIDMQNATARRQFDEACARL